MQASKLTGKHMRIFVHLQSKLTTCTHARMRACAQALCFMATWTNRRVCLWTTCHTLAGWRHSVVVSDKGQLYTFGWSKYGQLGHGDHGWVAVAHLPCRTVSHNSVLRRFYAAQLTSVRVQPAAAAPPWRLISSRPSPWARMLHMCKGVPLLICKGVLAACVQGCGCFTHARTRMLHTCKDADAECVQWRTATELTLGA